MNRSRCLPQCLFKNVLSAFFHNRSTGDKPSIQQRILQKLAVHSPGGVWFGNKKNVLLIHIKIWLNPRNMVSRVSQAQENTLSNSIPVML